MQMSKSEKGATGRNFETVPTRTRTVPGVAEITLANYTLRHGNEIKMMYESKMASLRLTKTRLPVPVYGKYFICKGFSTSAMRFMGHTLRDFLRESDVRPMQPSNNIVLIKVYSSPGFFVKPPISDTVHNGR